MREHGRDAKRSTQCAVRQLGQPKQLLDLAVAVRSIWPSPKPSSERPLRVLGDKFQRAPEWLAEADRQMRVIMWLVQPTEVIQAIQADPTDDRILECAIAANAEVIVSGDSHLLSLGVFRGIPIRRVAEFLGSLEDHGRGYYRNPESEDRSEVLALCGLGAMEVDVEIREAREQLEATLAATEEPPPLLHPEMVQPGRSAFEGDEAVPEASLWR